MEFSWKIIFSMDIDNMFEDLRIMGEMGSGRVVFTNDPARWVKYAGFYNNKVEKVVLLITDMPYCIDYAIEQVY